MHILCLALLALRLSLGLTVLNQVALPSSKEYLPDGHSQDHYLSKRQSSRCIYFFLLEPPTSLQCNPQVDNTLILTSTFLTSVTAPLRIGWFFSLNGIEAELIQSTRFVPEITFSAFTSKLVVLNALPGVYFYSAATGGRIFDSRALRITQATLQDVCFLGQNPVLQPAPRRCAQPIAINPSTIRVSSSVTPVTNTVNFQNGVDTPTLTYSAEFERMISPIVTATPPIVVTTPLLATTTQLEVATATPQVVAVTQQSNTIGIGIGVGIGLTVLVGVLVTALAIGSIYFIKKRERNQFTKFARANRQPLLSTPPDRPPPLLQGNTQGEQIELVAYATAETTPAGPLPLPYEKIGTTPRYSSEPVSNDSVVLQPELESRGSQSSDIYYSTPKFYSQRISSTSSSASGSSSNMYISPQQLEPFHPTIQEVTEQELMLSDVEESTGYTSSDFLPSGSSGEENDPDRSGDELLSTTEIGYSLEEPSKWVVPKDDMDGMTGQALEKSNQPTYINTQQQPEGDTSEMVDYVNARDEEHGYINTVHRSSKAAAESHASTKSAPATTKMKKKKQIKRKTSHPVYTGLLPENLNYTSVYSSTVRPERHE